MKWPCAHVVAWIKVVTVRRDKLDLWFASNTLLHRCNLQIGSDKLRLHTYIQKYPNSTFTPIMVLLTLYKSSSIILYTRSGAGNICQCDLYR